MKPFNLLHLLAVLAGVLTTAAPATAATLKLGDAAPPLQIARWVQGEPVTAFDTNHVYIVEFWATWCGPCRSSIPHLNEVWQKFKDKGVVVIGQDVWEQDESGVSAFVKKMDDKMTYRVALDDKSSDKDGAMAANWMKAAGQNGIPTAFVVNRHGKIAWIGHPMTLQESVLEQILADKFDVAAYAQEFEKQQEAQEARQALSKKLGQALREKNWDAADAAVAEMEKSLPKSSRDQMGSTRLQILLGRKDFAAAAKLAGSLSEAHADDASLQNALAWTLALTKDLDQNGLAVTEKIAGRANAAAKGKDSQILDTLARAQFRNGKTNEAVATEQKAVDLAPDEVKNFYTKFLNAYQQGRLPDVNE